MAGHLGAANRTVQNLEIVRIDAERQLLLVKGSVPGSERGHIVVKPAVKARPMASAAGTRTREEVRRLTWISN